VVVVVALTGTQLAPPGGSQGMFGSFAQVGVLSYSSSTRTAPGNAAPKLMTTLDVTPMHASPDATGAKMLSMPATSMGSG
jgi:hypothetical protein